MKILLVNKFLYPKGGAETYVLKLGDILEKRGHEVQFFGLEHEKNTVGNRAGIYVSGLDFSRGIRHNLTAPLRIICSVEARRKMRRLLEDFQPDVVHLNNIQFHLTPSVIAAAERYRRATGRSVKIVYTAHDYQLICPSHGLLDSRMRVCEKCLDGHYVHCVRMKCIKNSRLKSILGMLDGYFWKWSEAYSWVDTVICPSHFLKSKLDTQRRFRDKTVVLPNFVEPASPPDAEKEDYVLEFGYLSREKGTDTLLAVAERMPEVRFVFAGFGPLETDIGKVKNAEYVGFRTGKELEQLIRGAKLSVYPSRWHENCPYSVMESQICGTPVVASRMGGIPELLEEGKTGELFEAGNPRDLEETLRRLLSAPGLLARYAQNCREKTFETAESYYQKLMDIYET